MCFSRIVVLLLFTANAALAADGYMLGGGIESDNEDGSSASLIAGVGLSEDTWLSAGIAKSAVDLSSGRDLETWYADVELDHHFDPVGIRIGAAYWGDSDILESTDWRASVYFRNGKVMFSADYEFRDFDFTIPSLDFLNQRELMFDADGIGASARFQTSENTSLRLRGMKYDYSVPFRPVENADAARLFSVSRISLINSLVDNRAGLSFAIDQGLKRWEIDFSTWKGLINGSRTKSTTLRFLTPMTDKTDIEFGLGYDNSELYGDVTFFSVYLYFYGAD